MKVIFKTQQNLTLFENLAIGEVFSTARHGGLFVKTTRGRAVTIVPISGSSPVPAGDDSPWGSNDEIIRIKTLTIELEQ